MSAANEFRDINHHGFQNPPPPNMEVLHTGICARCRAIVRRVPVPTEEGYLSRTHFDLLCVAGHRFGYDLEELMKLRRSEAQ